MAIEEIEGKIMAEVVRRFPEMSGVHPSVAPLPNANRLFTFKTQMAAEDGTRLSLIVKVTADRDGNLLKVTTSRG